MSNMMTGHSAAYIEDMKKRLLQHRRWTSGTRGGARGDFSFHDMSHLPLGGAVLRNAMMIGACLAGSNLSKADLKASVLLMADMEGADLSGADLSGAILCRPICPASP